MKPYFAVAVICGGFVELLPQLEGDLRVFEGALGADDHLVAFLADDDGGLGHVPDLPGGKAHAWSRDGGKRGDTRLLKDVFSGLIKTGNQGGGFPTFFHNKKCIKEKKMPLLTKSFHVLIKVLAVDQLPGGTEGVGHGDGFSR